MIIQGLILIEGSGIEEGDLRFSLSNAKQIVLGVSHGFGWVVHIAANSHADFEKAFLAFAKVSGVKQVSILAMKT